MLLDIENVPVSDSEPKLTVIVFPEIVYEFVSDSSTHPLPSFE